MAFPLFPAQLCASDFTSFLARVFATVSPGTAFLPNWHLDVIGRHLAAAQSGEITRLLINMPPRTLKSVTISVAWPAWLLGHRPHTRIIGCSYAQSLAERHSTDCRLVMHSPWYQRLFPDTQLCAGQNEKHQFFTTQRGMRLATGTGGAITGEGGDFLIADDPLSALQGQSDASRRFAADWFHHSFCTRLNDKKRGVIVVVMQRLHADDLSGTLLAKGGWEHLRLPAIAEENETWRIPGGRIIRRIPGDAMHPAREGQPELARAKRELGSHHFAAQYQQNPLAQQGGMVQLDWFGRF